MIHLFKATSVIRTSDDLHGMKIGDTAPYSFEGENWAFKRVKDVMRDFVDLGISWS